MVSMDSNEVASDQCPESFLESFIANWIQSGRQISLIDLVDDAILESRTKIRNQLSRLPNESLIIHELDQASESSVLTLKKIASLLEDATKHFDNVENELIPMLNTIGKELRDQIRVEEGIKSMKSAKDSLNYKRIPSYDDFSHLEEEDEIDAKTLGGVKTPKDSKAPKDLETLTDSNAISNQSLIEKRKGRRISIPNLSDFPDCETGHFLSARNIISQDLMQQFPVGSDADADDGNQDGASQEDADQEDAPAFSFAFPRCQVSKSALALIDLVMQILDEAEMIIFSEDANEDSNKDANEDANKDANEDSNKDANEDANNEDAESDAEKSQDGASGGNKNTIPVKEKALELYITASKVIRLYQIMTPVKKKKLIKNSLTASALFHNNCLFMAHFLLTSPQIQDAPAQIKDTKILGANSSNANSSDANSFGANSCSRPGFNQIASLLEDEGRQVIQEAMKEEKYKFIEFFNSSSVLTSLIENATLSDDLKPFEFAAKKSVYLLNAISDSWKDILPIGVYNHLIGNLISFIFDEIITKILSIEDISASSANKMSQIMKYFQKECFETALKTDIKSEANLKDANKRSANFFNTQVPSSFKFNELRNALTASLADIVNRWGDGYGPLSMAFTDVQIKKLIRALFQNSEIRAVALSRIRNAEQS